MRDQPDPTIVNPARLDAEAGAQVCGQCHAYFVPKHPDRWWSTGFSQDYRPGGDLNTSRLLIEYDGKARLAGALIDADIESIFFRDGTIRVGGREYNGLVRSPCYERGVGKRKLRCLSCHEMHGADPVDQLKPTLEGDAACQGCHAKQAAGQEAHTHHARGSSGSRCYNCHMPFTTYALFKGIRSHRITSPNAEVSLRTGKPNACNLCHLDQSLAWTAGHLQRWYDQPPGRVSETGEQLSAAALDLLSGDAATRVITAYAMGWDAAQRASGTGWQAPLLAELLDDPYAAVRFVAQRSLRTLPGLGNFDYDFLAPANQRRGKKLEVQQEVEPKIATNQRGALPFQGGKLDSATMQRLIRQRDDRPIRISE
jgi:predicted CXXCH cytochrome family protein